MLIQLIIIWIIYNPVSEVKHGIGPNWSYGLCSSGSCLSFLLSLTSKEKSLTTWYLLQYHVSICKNRSCSCEKNISIRNVVSANTNGNFLEQNSQGCCKYCQKNCHDLPHFSRALTRPLFLIIDLDLFYEVVGLKTLKTDILYDFCFHFPSYFVFCLIVSK